MKVHPGMLMKTKKGRFQVSGARRQGGTGVSFPDPWELPAGKNAKMKVHPGMLMKTKERRFQVSGAGVSGGTGVSFPEPVGVCPRRKVRK